MTPTWAAIEQQVLRLPLDFPSCCNGSSATSVVGLRPNHLVASSKIFPLEHALFSFWIRHKVSAARFSKTEQKGIATKGGDAPIDKREPPAQWTSSPKPSRLLWLHSTYESRPLSTPWLPWASSANGIPWGFVEREKHLAGWGHELHGSLWGTAMMWIHNIYIYIYHHDIIYHESFNHGYMFTTSMTPHLPAMECSDPAGVSDRATSRTCARWIHTKRTDPRLECWFLAGSTPNLPSGNLT